MTLFTLFTAFIIIKYSKDRNVTQFALVVYIFSIALFGIKVFEVGYGQAIMMSGDEVYYYSRASLKDIDRMLWGLINNIVLRWDAFGPIFIKLINIPIGILTIASLSKVFDNKIPILYYVLFLPYVLIMFISNLRDILIIYVALLTFINLGKSSNVKTITKISIYLGCMYLLRPLYVVLILVIAFITKNNMLFLKGRIKDLKSRSKYRYIVPIIVIIIVGISPVYDLLINKYNYIGYKYIDNYELADNFRRNISYYSGNLVVDTIYGFIRFVFTPLPSSLISRVLYGFNQYGKMEDIIRIIHQIIYFYLLIYLTFNIRYFKKVLFNINQLQLSVLLFLFSYFPIYSFYLQGVSHQRTKLPFQLFIFVLYYLIRLYKARHENISLR
jgi:hypothetical protein